MRKLTLTLATAACALVVNACQDATQPEPVDPGISVVSATGGMISMSSGVRTTASVQTTARSFANLSAGDTPCVGTLTGTFDNVVVPQGQTCILQNSLVRGNAKALQDATLIVVNSEVRGNVEGDKADVVQVIQSTVGGNVNVVEAGNLALASCAMVLSNVQGNFQCEKNNPAAPRIFSGNIVRGNIKVEDNVSPPNFAFQIQNNRVDGDLQVFKNKGANLKLVTGNTVRQNLQCKENDQPFIGGPNSAGKAEDQCF